MKINLDNWSHCSLFTPPSPPPHSLVYTLCLFFQHHTYLPTGLQIQIQWSLFDSTNYELSPTSITYKINNNYNALICTTCCHSFQSFTYLYPKEKELQGVVVVAQLAERWLPITEVRGSNRVIGKFL